MRYEIQIRDATNIIGEVIFDFDMVAEIYDLSLDWDPVTKDVTASWLNDEDTKGVIYAWNTDGTAIGDTQYASAITASQFLNGSNRQSVVMDTNTLPGNTIYVGLRPFPETITSSTTATDRSGQRVDALATLRIPRTGEQPQWTLDHSKSGSIVTLE